MITLSRRHLFVLTGSLLLSSCAQDDSHNANANLKKLLSSLSQDQWLVHIGKEIFTETPDSYASQPVETLFEQHFSMPSTSDFDQFKAAIHAQISDDFLADKIHSYRNWVLSEKEAALYVAVYVETETSSATSQ